MPLPVIVWYAGITLGSIVIPMGISYLFPPEDLSKTLTSEQVERINAMILADKTAEEQKREIYKIMGFSITWEIIVLAIIVIAIIYLLLRR